MLLVPKPCWTLSHPLHGEGDQVRHESVFRRIAFISTPAAALRWIVTHASAPPSLLSSAGEAGSVASLLLRSLPAAPSDGLAAATRKRPCAAHTQGCLAFKAGRGGTSQSCISASACCLRLAASRSCAGRPSRRRRVLIKLFCCATLPANAHCSTISRVLQLIIT